MSVRLLEPKFVERVWGTTELQPLFPNRTNKIGEVWFDAGPGFPLLIKFIFTRRSSPYRFIRTTPTPKPSKSRAARPRCGTSSQPSPVPRSRWASRNP